MGILKNALFWILPRPRLVALGVLVLAAGSLAGAYGSQYLGGHMPCILCLYQRVPLAVIAGLMLAVLLLPRPGRRWRWTLVSVAGLLYLGEAGLAGFHVGVEQHWWASIESCTDGAGTATTVDALKAELMARPPCDQVTWRLFGLSMAAYNFLMSLALGVALIGLALLHCRSLSATEREQDHV